MKTFLAILASLIVAGAVLALRAGLEPAELVGSIFAATLAGWTLSQYGRGPRQIVSTAAHPLRLPIGLPVAARTKTHSPGRVAA